MTTTIGTKGNDTSNRPFASVTATIDSPTGTDTVSLGELVNSRIYYSMEQFK